MLAMKVKLPVKDSILEREVLEVIKSQYDNIFSAEKKVADYVLNNPHKTVDMNVSELAKLSGVSDATVVRTCHHLGYKGYYQFRITLSRDLGRKKERISREKDAIDKIFGQFAQKLHDIEQQITVENMIDCVNLIKECETVHILAVGNAANIAQYLGFRLGRLGIKSSYNVAPEYCINHINLAEKEDILIAISKSGMSKQVIRGIELAKERGMKAIAITASEHSSVAELADFVLLSKAQNEAFDNCKRYSYLNELAVIDAMLVFFEDDEKISFTKAEEPKFVLAENKV